MACWSEVSPRWGSSRDSGAGPLTMAGFRGSDIIEVDAVVPAKAGTIDFAGELQRVRPLSDYGFVSASRSPRAVAEAR